MTAQPYAKELSFRPPTGFLPRTIAPNCRHHHFAYGEELLIDNLAADYLPEGRTEREYDEISVSERVMSAFPPSFVMTARVFHVNIKLPVTRLCNDEECSFFLSLLREI